MTGNVVFGLTLDQRAREFGAATMEDILATGDWADQSEQFGAIFCGDSLLAKPRLEAVSLLSAIAGRTRRVKLGTSCMASFPLRHPIWTAYQWATLDVISNGRAILAVCIGGGPGGRTQGSGDIDNEFRAMGVELKTRVRRLEESIDIIRKLWAGDHVSYQGEFYQFNDVSLNPKPIQQPPPIWTVSNTTMFTKDRDKLDRPLRRAGRIADGWQTASVWPGVVRESLEKIRCYAQEYGRDPSGLDCCVQITINVNDDVEKSFSETKRFLDLYYSADYARQDLPRWGAFGPPEACAQTIQMLIDEGATYVTLRLASWNRREMFKRVSEEVLPLLRTRLAVPI